MGTNPALLAIPIIVVNVDDSGFNSSILTAVFHDAAQVGEVLFCLSDIVRYCYFQFGTIRIIKTEFRNVIHKNTFFKTGAIKCLYFFYLLVKMLLEVDGILIIIE